MSLLDDVISKGKGVASAAGSKVNSTASISKLKVRENQVNTEIKGKFRKLGELIYGMSKSGEKDNAEFDALIAEIDANYEELAEIDEQLDVLKGLLTCTKCGAKTSNDNFYCPKCGTKLPEKKVEVPVDDEE